jgi:hypothetical protein
MNLRIEREAQDFLILIRVIRVIRGKFFAESLCH